MDDRSTFLPSYPRRLVRRIFGAYQGFNEHDGFLMAAAMAYYFALSLFPLLLVLVAGLGVALQSTVAGQDAQERLLVAIEQQVSPELSQQIGRSLHDREQQRLVRRADRLCRAIDHGDRGLHADRSCVQSHLAAARRS